MSATMVASVVGIAAGVQALSSGGGGSGGGASTNPSFYDPFAGYRPQFAQQLSNLMANPSTALGMPGFASQLQSGEQAVNAGMAATGQVNSGAQQVALQNLGMAKSGDYFQQMLSNLSQLSGASSSPLGGAQAAANAANQQQQNQYSGLGMITSGIGSLYNSYTGGSSGGTGGAGLAAAPGSNYNSFGMNFGGYQM